MNSVLYTVVFASGGRENAEWRRLRTQGTRASAEADRDEIVKAGRPAYVRKVAELEAHGLPEGPAPGWDYSRLRWKNGAAR